MAIPSECKMPDLSGLGSPLMWRLIPQMLVGESYLSKEASRYRKTFIRLRDKALREYHEARKAILAQTSEKEKGGATWLTNMTAFTDHMENCLNAVSRLFRLLETIKSEKQSPAFPRNLLKLVETEKNSVREIRDAVEHMDKDIQKDKITSGEPIMLVIVNNDDSVRISKYQMTFEDLAMVLRKMHDIALYMLIKENWKLETAELSDEKPR